MGKVQSTGNDVGGICGYSSEGDIQNVYNIGEVSGKNYVGGIFGNHSGYTSMRYLYNVGNITGKQYVGGICGYRGDQSAQYYGYNIGEITGEDYVGGVIGGFYERYNIITSYQYNIGKVVATKSYVGGIVGRGGSSALSGLNQCYYEENTALYGIGATTLTSGKDSNTTKSTMEEMPTILSVVNYNNAFVEDTEGINNGYPILAWQVE